MAADAAEGATGQHQQGKGGRDSTVAGRDVITNYYGPGGDGMASPSRKIWGGVPARNPGFKGREELLGAVRDALAGGDRAVVQALHGMGGVGKTQIAIEYAHRFAVDYDLVWWVNSERPELIAEQFAMLGNELGCTRPGAQVAEVQRAVLSALHERARWLLVFDNVERPDHVAPWLPGGAGHVVITSRFYGWDDLAVPVSVDVFSRAESKEILQGRVKGLTDADSGEVAEAVGDLPLAVAQAAGYMAYTGIPAAEYVALLRTRPAEMMELGKPWQYSRSLAAATRLSLEQMQSQDPAAAEVVSICAFLAPEPVPAEWFPKAVDELPEALGEQARDPVAWRQVIFRLRGSGLLRVDPDGLVMHRLTQAIIRDHLPAGAASSVPGLAAATVAANLPGDPNAPGMWQSWARFLPHLMALDPAASDDNEVRGAAARAVRYLVQRGEAVSAHAMGRHLCAGWNARFDAHDRLTLLVGDSMAGALSLMGRYAEARDTTEGILARYRQKFGDDDPGTLTAASNLANKLRDLGEYTDARQLDEDNLARLRRVLGDDHPETLRSASNLGDDLCLLGQYAAALEMEQDTLTRFRRVLGEDHPETLRSALNLAADYRGLGEYTAARQLDEDTLSRYRHVAGNDHPHALWTASNLAVDLRALGEYQAARELDEETLARRRRVLGDDHRLTQQSVRDLAEDLRLLGEEA